MPTKTKQNGQKKQGSYGAAEKPAGEKNRVKETKQSEENNQNKSEDDCQALAQAGFVEYHSGAIVDTDGPHQNSKVIRRAPQRG